MYLQEKTNAVRAMAQQQRLQQQQAMLSSPLSHMDLSKPVIHPREASGSISPSGLPHATLDLSSVTTTTPHELSTLV